MDHIDSVGQIIFSLQLKKSQSKALWAFFNYVIGYFDRQFRLLCSIDSNP